MRKRAKKLLALLTAVTVTVTGVNVPAAQAAKVSVKASQTTLYYNGTKAQKKATVTVKNAKKKVTYSISKAGKKIVSLGKISGKKTKKFTVTAKKAGKATVTVKVGGKKVKSIKFTVKKKTTKATPVPTVAPTQAPTQEPSQEPTVAPSDAPTVAPTDAPSDAPTVAPTDEPVKDKPVVTEIVIKNKVALTNAAVENSKIAAEEAYVYYDVLDQYGESMRDTVTINWTTSPSNCSVDKSTGKITIKKNEPGVAIKDRKAFTYGEQIYVVGVHAATGTSVTTSVSVGLTQTLDTIKFAGFVADKDKATILDKLPTSFAKGTDTYYMAFKAYDQNGDVVESVGSDDVTFVSDNPMLAKLDTKLSKPLTIKGEEYNTIVIAPGDYADKGGEVNVTAIATKTGNRTPLNIVVGTAGVLDSFEIVAPKDTVYDGDLIELEYVAKDKEGNQIKNYETIVRSSNELKLSATDSSELRVTEKADGTAQLTWLDAKYAYNDNGRPAPKGSANMYNQAEVCDGVARMVTLNTTVIGGTGSYLLLNVEDARIPVSVSAPDKVTANKMDVTYKFGTCGWHDAGDLTFKDQYGHTMSNVFVDEFLNTTDGSAANKTLGGSTNGFIYQVKAVNSVASGSVVDANYSRTSKYHGNWGALGFDFALNKAVTEKTEETLTFTIQRVKAGKAWTDSSVENCGKKNTATITVVPVKDLASTLEISGLDNVIYLDKSITKAEIDAKTISGATIDVKPTYTSDWSVTSNEFTVVGTYGGQKLRVHDDYINLATCADTGVGVALKGDGSAYQVNNLNVANAQLTPDKLVEDVTSTGTMKYKQTKVDFKLVVTAEDSKTYNVAKTAKFDCSAQKATKIAINIYDGFTKNPTNTDIASVANSVAVTDQYGWLIQNAPYVLKVTDLKEADTDLQHKANSLKVIGNNTSTIKLEGAEIGDSFTLTAVSTDDDSVTHQITVTLEADTKAFLSNLDDTSDTTLCKKYLGYTVR